MTNAAGGQFWRGSNQYRQQTVDNPNSNQRPNNARFAVWHLSRMYKLYRFEDPPRYGSDGRARRGEKTEYDFLCNVQPFVISNSNRDEYKLMKLPSGYEAMAMIICTYDPFIHKSQIPGYQLPDKDIPMYKDGIFIRTADQRTRIAETGFNAELNHGQADWLLYDGQFWQAVAVDYTNGGDEELNGEQARIGHAIFAYIDDKHQEKHASIDNRSKTNGADF